LTPRRGTGGRKTLYGGRVRPWAGENTTDGILRKRKQE